MATSIEPRSLSELPLLVWLSPGFPVGAYAYSHALEWAAEAADLTGFEQLSAWLDDLLDHGAPRSDAILFAEGWRAARAQDWRALSAVNELALALCGAAERRLETASQGDAFIAAIRAAWPHPALNSWPAAGETAAYPIAVAAVAAAHGLALEPSLAAFLLSFLANLVSASIRLGVIGQTDGQRLLARLTPRVQDKAAALKDLGLDDLGSCAIRSDIAAMRHETQYSRLFRS